MASHAPRGSWTVHALILSVLHWLALGNSYYLNGLCRDEYCKDPAHPVLEYDGDKGGCLCTTHPCWNDNGRTHSCKEDAPHKFLHFTYHENGTLHCLCSSIPYYESRFIARDLCLGHYCEDPDFPVLDIDDLGECVCKAHPCWNAKGRSHTCESPIHPILRYRQDVWGDPICDCMSRLESPQSADAKRSEL
mmetsp:Transcript_38510/g.86594  ORF Transcript_38510/g.86594 Transcript_38510/m.86594 type:complete len:191 (+) Transcript_38510:64-636(+)